MAELPSLLESVNEFVNDEAKVVSDFSIKYVQN